MPERKMMDTVKVAVNRLDAIISGGDIIALVKIARLWLPAVFWLIWFDGYAQEEDRIKPASSETVSRQGSYLSHGEAVLEDNSFVVDEAFNQGKGSVQYMACYQHNRWKDADPVLSFCQELPLRSSRHQLGYSLAYVFHTGLQSNSLKPGPGDASVHYSYWLKNTSSRVMVVPKLIAWLPIGKAIHSNGSGGWGGKLSLAMTTKLSGKWVVHTNVLASRIWGSRHYFQYGNATVAAGSVEFAKRNLNSLGVGFSVNYLLHPRFHFVLEKMLTSEEFAKDDSADMLADNDTNRPASATVARRTRMLLIPGFRWAINGKDWQLVPAVGCPLEVLSENPWQDLKTGGAIKGGLVLYLSFETN